MEKKSVPGLLEAREPAFDFEYDTALKFILQYDSLPVNPDITVNYKHLIRLERERIKFYFPDEIDNKYSVNELLGGITSGRIDQDETMQIFRTIKVLQTKDKQ